MALKIKTHDVDRIAVVQRKPKTARTAVELEQMSHPDLAFQRVAAKAPSGLRPADIFTLQRTIGNRAVQRMLNRPQAERSLPSSSAGVIQRLTEEAEPLQGKFEPSLNKENRTGLPDKLKAGIENLSGLSLDDVKVNYNSEQPAYVQALAYTQGTDIHIGPRQEKHLPHEAWHAVQQKQGRVKPTLQAKGVAISDDDRLEKEADMMGALAARASNAIHLQQASRPPGSSSPVIQRVVRVENIDYIPGESQSQPGAFKHSDFVVKDIEAELKRTSFWARLTGKEIDSLHEMSASNIKGVDIPSLAKNIIAHISANSQFRFNALMGFSKELEHALGEASASEASDKEVSVFKTILKECTLRSRSKGVASEVDLDKLPPGTKDFLQKLNAIIKTRHLELDDVAKYPLLDSKGIDSSSRASAKLNVRSPHENKAGWLPQFKAATKEKALEGAIPEFLKQFSRLARSSAKADRVEYLRRTDWFEGKPIEIENRTKMPENLKKVYYRDCFAETVNTRAQRAQLAWARYVNQFGETNYPYVEFTAENADGVSRVIYDYMNDIFYITLHYNWVQGFNPFFKINKTPHTM